eukprot:TRINITY_DN4754_c0_g2_i1.p1 TRINITY_DN4754_c0_g2~~TRINITY_DN4754_c0_g2_i1.p1  ORF type:complete len:528 (-),score=78.05 TRINITY_DN4754_c0_g2_i1:224-1708(-)
MGCASGKQQTAVPVIRRAISLGELGPEGSSGSTHGGDSDEDRHLLLQLSKQQVLEFAANATMDRSSGRQFSIGTSTDRAMHRVPSFSSKSVELQGEEADLSRDGIGYSCRKGQKPESPNQDSFFIMKVDGEFSVHGVFDGHGRKGHDISNFVKDNLPKLLLSQPNLQEDPLTALTRSFERMQRLIIQATEAQVIDANRSGTTVSVIFYDHRRNVLHVGHVGDSRVVLGRILPGPADQHVVQAVDLTIDHKPDIPAERARIEKAGGRVVHDGGWNYRVYAKGNRGPGLNMSRAMGDLTGHFGAGISAIPDVNSHPVGNDLTVGGELEKEGDVKCSSTLSESTISSSATMSSYAISKCDRFVLLCSDGVWEFVSSQEAVSAVADFETEHAMEAAEHLAQMSWDRWIRELQGQVVDDITVLVVNLASTRQAAPPQEGSGAEASSSQQPKAAGQPLSGCTGNRALEPSSGSAQAEASTSGLAPHVLDVNLSTETGPEA